MGGRGRGEREKAYVVDSGVSSMSSWVIVVASVHINVVPVSPSPPTPYPGSNSPPARIGRAALTTSILCLSNKLGLSCRPPHQLF